MAEGNFYPNAALHLQVEGNTYTVSMTNSMEEDAPDYTGEATLRVYCEDADNTVIEVVQDGEYTEVESTVIGSYRQFTMEVPGSFRTVEVEGSHTLLIVLCIVGGAVVILLIVLLGKKRQNAGRRARRQNVTGKPERLTRTRAAKQTQQKMPDRRLAQRNNNDSGSFI